MPSADVCLDSKPSSVPPLNHEAGATLRQPAPVGAYPWAAPCLAARMADAEWGECPGIAFDGERVIA